MVGTAQSHCPKSNTTPGNLVGGQTCSLNNRHTSHSFLRWDTDAGKRADLTPDLLLTAHAQGQVMLHAQRVGMLHAKGTIPSTKHPFMRLAAV